MNGVKAVCRKCGQEAPVEQFKLHYEFRQMVCFACYSGKTKLQQEKKEQEKAVKRPVGWDAEDEYLEKASRSRLKEDHRGTFTKIPGTPQVRYTCICSYTFKYDPFTKSPKTCPYCNGEIPRLRTFSLL
jgi:hypothetical protein